MQYPIHNEDLIQMGRRMANREKCTIPCRNDITLHDGTVAKNCLSWGSPRAYELYEQDGVVYSRLTR